ncbi:MAG TPA: translation initiation factor IF-2 [Candidatus Hydrogenedentes bacterium]|jgi:translation initiation factor IF-2|nr:translation initiation factor IF-2 [Candidatus Hydrogenedentota bacterium]HPJ99129.1 translation initiation factor IF-2 [Candidatus Hydrogenedentota bacterium]
MQTVASLAKRLDMTAEEALEKLRFMLMEVESVDSELTDDQCDLLIDVDDDPSVAERVRQKKLDEEEKARKRTERLQAAAKKAAAKRKLAAKKKPAAKKTPTKAKAASTKAAAKKKKSEDEPEESPLVEILRPEAEEEAPAAAAEAAGKAETKKAAPKKAAAKKPARTTEPDILIGRAVDHEDVVQIIRADGTRVKELDAVLEETPVFEDDEAELESAILAEAERHQEEEEARKAREAARAMVKPDPAVVAEVKRRAEERMARKRQQRAELAATVTTAATAAPATKRTVTGKTARKRQKRVERQRAEEAMRRDAAAKVREFQAAGPTGQIKKRRKKRDKDDELGSAVDEIFEKHIIEVDETMTVEQLAEALDMATSDVILELMEHNILANKNQSLSFDLIRQIGEAHGYEVRSAIPGEEEIMAEEPDAPEDLVLRPPVVTVMGHVDHGKTTLLDYLRRAHVAEGEVGGITQHIAAYDVEIRGGRVVFLDTPGHAAFTQMRARGAQATDVVVLVIAADDGIMPQTVEAIDHARAAEVPIVVAINKCDKPEAQPDRIRQELVKYDLVDEQWGGKTIIRNISAKTGEGVDTLMEMLVLEAEMLELRANPRKKARGAVVESELSKGQGPVAWVLVQTGTLHVGDVFLAGETYGRVRAMINSRGEQVENVPPATPVLVLGFNDVATAGDQFVVVDDERIARAIAEKRIDRAKLKQGATARRITLEDFHKHLKEGERHVLNVVIKADVQGSVDVLESNLLKLGNEDVKVELVHSGVGGINESDVILASASDAVIIGFHVTANPRVRKLAEQEGVDIRTYRIIYEVIDEVKKALEGLLTPETKEVVTGHVEIREIFRSSAIGNIAGCYVQDGEISRASLIRVVRNDVVLYEGRIASLRREKDDVRSVATGFECGIVLESFQDVKVGDIIEAYRLEQVAQKLE